MNRIKFIGISLIFFAVFASGKISRAADLFTFNPQPDFGDAIVNGSLPVTFQVTRTSGSPGVIIQGMNISGENANDFTINEENCVSRSDSCQIEIAFKPSSIGEKNATLTVSTRSATISGQLFSQEIPLVGNGVLFKFDPNKIERIPRDGLPTFPIPGQPTPGLPPLPPNPPDVTFPEPVPPQPTAEPTPQQPAPELPPSPTDQVESGNDERTLQGGAKSIFSCSLLDEGDQTSFGLALWLALPFLIFLKRQKVKIK